MIPDIEAWGKLEQTPPEDDPRSFGLFAARYIRWIIAVFALLAMGPIVTFLMRGQLWAIPGVPLIAIVSFIVLLGMGLLYLYAYSLYDDSFYAFIAIGWFANAVYVCWEGFVSVNPREGWWQLAVYVFAQLYELPFLISANMSQPSKASYRQIFNEFLFWSVAFGSSVGLQCVLNYQSFANGNVGRPAIIVAICFAMRVFIGVGLAFKRRLKPRVHALWSYVIPGTFFAYAAIQVMYFWRKSPDISGIAFFAALSIKIVNGCGVSSMAVKDLGTLKQRLEITETWQDLGNLTLAIEHDIKSPIQVISNDLKRLEEKNQSNKDVSDRVASIKAELLRILATTEIVRTLRGGREFYGHLMEKTNVRGTLERSVKAVKAELSANDIHFRWDNRSVFINCYPPQLQQVLVNLLRNAVEAIREESSRTGVISVDYKMLPGQEVAIRVKDNGCGMPPDAVAKLGRFYTTKGDRKPNGGVGLYISTRILSFHGARMAFDTKPHEGTIVSVIFPLWQPSSRPPAS